MSTSRTHRLLMAATAGCATLAIVALVVSQYSRMSGVPALRSTIPVAPAAHIGAGGTRTHVVADGALLPPHLRLTPALARAYAAVGQLRDGQAHACDHLDNAALAELAHAEELVAMVVAIPGTRVPTRLPDSSVLQMADPTSADHALAGDTSSVQDAQAAVPGRPVARSASTGAHASSADDAVPAGALPSASGATAAAVEDDHAVAHQLVAGARSPMPIRGDQVKQLIAPNAWVAIPYKPAQVAGAPLIIQNISGGDYALALYGSDFGSVRLDGGLIVPGRFYRINGSSRIDSQVPLVVHIRPLNAVGPYYPQSLQVPSADG